LRRVQQRAQVLQLALVLWFAQPQGQASAQGAARNQAVKEQRRGQLSWIHLHSGLSLSQAAERDNSFSRGGNR
jgi:hypothetical protein